MHKLKELKEMLERELEKVTKKGELSAGSLDIVDKLTHSIKSIDTIMAMEEYSEDDYAMRGGGSSYASPTRGRGANANRDSRGRYTSRYDYDGSYARGGSSYARDNRGYSREDAKEELLDHLYELEGMAKDAETKHMLKKFIKQAEED